jgi:hypothetical protein
VLRGPQGWVDGHGERGGAGSEKLRVSLAPRLTCGSLLEESRDAAAAGEEKLVSYAAEQSKYCSICTVTLDPCGDLPFTSRGRWKCLRGGAGGLNGCYAACGCGTEYRCGALLGEDVRRHA